MDGNQQINKQFFFANYKRMQNKHIQSRRKIQRKDVCLN